MMKLFRGFVPTKNKKCLMKFKNVPDEDLQTYEEIKSLPEFAGILSEECILIDIDDKEQSEILMNIVEDLQLRCRVYETTRGKHFLFKNTHQESCKTHTMLACGLKSDIKVGCRNSYSILKFKNKERKIIYDIFDDEDYQDIPKWLLPIRNSFEFLNMEAGDGRNQSLFNYILTLQSNDFTVEECRECIRIINKYVIKNPLSDSEVETILRDDAFNKPVFFGKRGTFLFDKFATYLKNNNHVIKINDQLHIYDNGVYVQGTKAIESVMINHIPNLNRTKRAEVLTYLDLLVTENSESSDAELIAFKNGVFNIETNEFFDFSPEFIITNKIPFNYVPGAKSELLENTLNKLACDDKKIRLLLEEVAGYVLYRRNELRKAFILIGDKANGKSTYLDMIKTLLGDKNTTALDLKELGDRFKTAEIFGKLACIGDDIGDEFIPNPAVFKKLTSGDRLNAERKGQNPFDFNSYAKLLFSANNIPRIKDKSGAVISRLVIIPFNATFSKADKDYDPYIKYKLRKTETMEALIQLGIEGLKRVLENREFTTSKKVQKELEEYEENNNPILIFFKEEPKIENESTTHVYKQYAEFCTSNSFTPLSKIEFSRQVKKRYGLDIVNKSVNGKRVRVFTKGG